MSGRIQNYLLKQEIKRGPNPARQFIEWEKIQYGVIITEGNSLQLVKEFVKQIGKKFEIIVFHNDKISGDKDVFLSVNRKDFSIWGLPKPEILQKLRAKPFDLLITLDFKNSAQLKALSGLTPAKCKVGQDGADYMAYFDISIQSNEADFLKQSLKYLMMIKT